MADDRRVRDDDDVTWVIEDFELDVDQYDLRRSGEQVRVEPQVFDVLVYLVEHRERVVPRTELLDEIWGDRFVSDSALSSRIKAARQALDDDGSAQRMIRTVHGRGFQFVGRVTEMNPTRPSRREPDSRRVQEIRFCRTDDDVRIAYASMGSGPSLVRAAHWMTHLDYDLSSPVWSHWLDGLAADRTLIRYDERGCGMSDHDVEDFSVDTWVRDLETVVDAAGLETFDLLGLSQGGPVAIRYAVRHPERVRRLVLFGTYAAGIGARAASEQERTEAGVQQEIASLGWGRADDSYLQLFASQFVPDADQTLWREFAQLQRRTTSAENARRFLEAFALIDVRAEAPSIRAPTLIFHVRGDLRVPFDQALELAALIPDSRLIPLESNNHLMRADEPAFAVFLDELNRFLSDG